ncbi:hypothetical protein STSP2_03297 [Anaerohalosphaera lusitana]|uniref:Uncharacterized protein n=2 Tax=Anaerohalosphaera lusitana TaxID=1936003 RepID=A0A1U9NQJ5_9BACT|nr:hypothetical protein STSP2_03297 [Anaerohalosphaera lusitana]
MSDQNDLNKLVDDKLKQAIDARKELIALDDDCDLADKLDCLKLFVKAAFDYADFSWKKGSEYYNQDMAFGLCKTAYTFATSYMQTCENITLSLTCPQKPEEGELAALINLQNRLDEIIEKVGESRDSEDSQPTPDKRQIRAMIRKWNPDILAKNAEAAEMVIWHGAMFERYYKFIREHDSKDLPKRGRDDLDPLIKDILEIRDNLTADAVCGAVNLIQSGKFNPTTKATVFKTQAWKARHRR